MKSWSRCAFAMIFAVSLSLASVLVPHRVSWSQSAGGKACGFSAGAWETLGRVTVSVRTCEGRAGQPVIVHSGDDAFLGRVNERGEAEMEFAQVTDKRIVTVELQNSDLRDSFIKVVDSGDFYRVVLRWRFNVQLYLHVIEPGRKPADYGHVHADRRNLDLRQGAGMLDIAGGAPVQGFAADQSYVVSDRAGFVGGAFQIGVEYVARGQRPAPPYCGDEKLARIPFQIFEIDRGHIKSQSYNPLPATCGEELPSTIQRLRGHGQRRPS